MNRKVLIEFFIGNGFLAVKINQKYYGIVPAEHKLKPVYVPVNKSRLLGK
ncbi:hypothetical protein [Mucilaginibacter sp.]